MATLYELTEKQIKLLQLAEDGTVDPAVLADTMDAIDDAIEDKAVAYVQVAKQIDADVEVIDAEIKRLSERKASYKKNATLIKQRLVEAMQETGHKKFKTPLFTIWVQDTPSVKIEDDDPANVEIAYVHEERRLIADKKMIKDALKAGKDVKGATLVYSSSLRTR